MATREERPGAEARARRLLELAEEEFGSVDSGGLKPAEVQVLRAAAMREVAEIGTPFRTIRGEGNGIASAWGKDERPEIRKANWERWMVRAAVLRWVCGGCEEVTKLVEPSGVRVIGAVIEGELDLSALEIPFPVWCDRCIIKGGVTLDDARTDLVVFEGSRCGGFRAERAHVQGNLHLRAGLCCEGEARVGGAAIEGDLDCSSATFVNHSGLALFADRVRVTGSVFLSDGFSATGAEELGAVRLVGAEIGGNLSCTAGTFLNEDGPALIADHVRVTGTVFLSAGFSATGAKELGAVRLVGAEIGGNLACRNGRFVNKSGNALSAQGATIHGTLFLDPVASWEGALDLISARVGVYIDDAASMTLIKPIRLDGIRFTRFGAYSPRNGGERARWIKKADGGRFVPEPYETVACALDRMGHEDDAREVRIALERARHRHEYTEGLESAAGWRDHAYIHARYRCKFLVRWLLEYGYDKWRPARYMALLAALGTVVFWGGYGAGLMAPASDQVLTWGSYSTAARERRDEITRPIKNDDVPPPVATSPRVEGLLPPDYPIFNSLAYSLHTLLPVVDLRQQEYWLPASERGCVVRPSKLIGNRNGWSFEWSWAGWWLRGYMWFQTLAGWVLALFLIAGLTGLVKHKPVSEEGGE